MQLIVLLHHQLQQFNTQLINLSASIHVLYLTIIMQLMCPHNIFDPLGHHTVTCKFGGDVVSRHNQLRDTLSFVKTCRITGVSASIEAGCWLGHDHLHTRPADVLLPNWICSKPAALDFTVVSPLGSSHIVEAGTTTGPAALSAEERKHIINIDQKYTESSTVY